MIIYCKFPLHSISNPQLINTLNMARCDALYILSGFCHGSIPTPQVRVRGCVPACVVHGVGGDRGAAEEDGGLQGRRHRHRRVALPIPPPLQERHAVKNQSGIGDHEKNLAFVAK